MSSCQIIKFPTKSEGVSNSIRIKLVVDKIITRRKKYVSDYFSGKTASINVHTYNNIIRFPIAKNATKADQDIKILQEVFLMRAKILEDAIKRIESFASKESDE